MSILSSYLKILSNAEGKEISSLIPESMQGTKEIVLEFFDVSFRR